MQAASFASSQEPAHRAETVLTQATLRSAELLGLNNAALGSVVGLSESTISRMKTTGHLFQLNSKSAELAMLLIRVYRSLDALVGNNEQHRRLWMTSYNQALNATPKDAVKTAEGLGRVITYLDGARALV